MTANQKIQEDYKTHFAFGENWSNFSENIDDAKIQEALNGFTELCPPEKVKGKTLIDIGSGSGLHSLSALRLGAKHVTAFDIDENSVNTTRSVLDKHWDNDNYDVQIANILVNPPTETFDIVYSWGVLHHTGAMWDAINNASKCVKDNGNFILAIYTKTRFCNFWEKEKKLFTKAPRLIKTLMTSIYSALLILRYLAKGKNPYKEIKNYNQYRGMSWWHDRVDWLGGWPYESASAEEIIAFMKERGFELEHSQNTAPPIGLLGTGCGEYVFKKTSIK